MTPYTVRTTAEDFLMTAPLNVISHVLHLHPAAERRIVEEMQNGQVCRLHFNGRFTFLGHAEVVVTAN